jgi:hypothetical protein
VAADGSDTATESPERRVTPGAGGQRLLITAFLWCVFGTAIVTTTFGVLRRREAPPI